MDINKVNPLNYKFHSITNLYKGFPHTNLNLELYQYGTDSVEVKLINTDYPKQRNALRKQFIYLVLCFYAYFILFLFKSFHLAFIDTILITCTIPLLWRLSSLVEYEKFIFCYDFGIHLQTQKFSGKHNKFVAASYIHDIVINEVLENFDFRYLLILRTKGKLFHNKPIIPLFTILKPSYECLSLVYKHLNNVMIKNPNL